MSGHVQAGALVTLAHPQAETRDQVQHLEDDERYDEGVGDRRNDPDGLYPQLLDVPFDQSLDPGESRDREDTGRQRTPDAADAVDREHVQRVVDPQPRADQHGEVAEHAGAEADPQRTHDADGARSGRDGDESADSARRDSSRAHALVLDLRQDAPRERGSCGCRVRHEEGVDGDSVRCETGACVEPEPAEPEQRGADNDVRHVAGLQAGVTALAEQQRCGHGGHGGVDVDNRAAREVERAKVEQPAVAGPHPVGDGRVDQRYPGNQEDEVGGELEPLHHRSRDQGRCDDGEHHLEDGKQHVVAGLHTGQADEGEVSHDGAALTECDAVAPEDPHNADHCHAHEAQHDGADDVAAADQTSVEEGKPRRHEQHQSRCGQQPGNRTTVHSGTPPELR